MEMYTKSQLQSKKVAELKELSESLDIKTNGLKKDEIIESLLHYFESENVDASMDASVKNQDIEEIDEPAEMVQTTELSENSDLLIEEPKSKIEKESEFENKASSNKIAVIRKPTMLYKDKSLTEPICNINGKVLVLEAGPNYFRISIAISGRGQLIGYIFKSRLG